VRVVKYEDFVASPELSLDLIFSALGIEKIPAARKVLPAINEKYFGQWHRFRRGLFTRGGAGRLVKEFGERVCHFGYDMKTVEQLHPYP
jgi:hypothetical protein